MEYFTRLLKVVGSNPQFAYHPSCRSLRLNHFMFADDVTIFCKAHPQTLSIIHHTLMAFFHCAGLQANQEKSQIVFGGCTPTLQQQCLEAIGFKEGPQLMRYLGVPVTASRLARWNVGHWWKRSWGRSDSGPPKASVLQVELSFLIQ